MIKNLKIKIKNLESVPGVYIFKNIDGEVIYIGKATSLRDRVTSYFQKKSSYVRPIEMMIAEVFEIEVKKTETVLEAYILEQELIKKFQPKYNVEGKDDKSFSYVVFTKEDFPRPVVLRRTDFSQNLKLKIRASKVYGPYTSKKNIEIALKILRKIFPYHAKIQKSEKGCLDFQLGLCPGPYVGAITKEDYAKNIRGIRMILEGKKKSLLAKMKKEMLEFGKKQEFEKAAETRNQIFSLQHIQDIALVSDNTRGESWNEKTKKRLQESASFRIEGYDISNISGAYSVGSMVVFDNSQGKLDANKNQYRKFKIKSVQGANDIGSMEEVLMRRFGNNWAKPSVMLLDGGAGHLNMARRVLRAHRLSIPILAVAKGKTRKKLDLRSFGSVPEIPLAIIERVRDEAHRFAIAYHKKVREKEFMRDAELH